MPRITGESNVIVTDTNSEANILFSWAAHTTNTNANDAITSGGATTVCAGTWFLGRTSATTKADNPMGAFLMASTQ
jgi:hypothetical protein